MKHSSNLTYRAERLENEMNYSCPLSEIESDLENVAKIAAFVIIITVSLTGNILIITVTRRNRRLRKVAFSFIVNTAIADLCTTVINMPESLLVEINDTDEWMSGDIGLTLCKLLPFCQQVCSYCSILSLLAIAFDRFFAICFPLKKRITRKRSRVIIASTWVIPCISSAPMLLANNVVEIDGLLFCVEEWPALLDSMTASRSYTIILFVMFYLASLIIITLLYSCAFYNILKRKVLGNHSSKTRRVYSKSRRKALKMFVTVVVCFALCWLPYHVVYFLATYNVEFYNCGVPPNIHFISLFFAYAISAFNPCIYMIFNQDYRDGAKRLLSTCWR